MRITFHIGMSHIVQQVIFYRFYNLFKPDPPCFFEPYIFFIVPSDSSPKEFHFLWNSTVEVQSGWRSGDRAGLTQLGQGVRRQAQLGQNRVCLLAQQRGRLAQEF